MSIFCPECNSEMYITDGYFVCHSCGCVDMAKVQYITEYYNRDTARIVYKQLIFYKRSNYFIHVLKMMTCKEMYTDTKIYKIAKRLKKSKIKNIEKIKKWLKLKKYNNYIKYIYNIYFFAYDKKLIDLTNTEYQNIISDFKKYDRLYCKKISTRNQLNYNFIIYKLFSKRKYSTTNILLPRTLDKLNDTYDTLYLT